MLGTWVMPHQNGRGMNGQNPDAQHGYGFLERKPGTGAETSSELAGKNPEAAAQQAEQTLKGELKSFRGAELKMLVGVTIKVIQENNLVVQNTNRIREEVISIATPFDEEADRLAMKTSAEIQEVSNNSGSTRSNEPPFSPFGSNTPSKQNPQGPVLAA